MNKINSLLAKSRIGVTLSAIAIAILGLMAGPLTAPASAASDCWSGRFCVWMDPGFVNVRATWTDNNIMYCYQLAPAYDNNISSAHNLTGHDVVLYDTPNCSGANAYMGFHAICDDFNRTDTAACGGATGLQRNQASSLMFVTFP